MLHDQMMRLLSIAGSFAAFGALSAQALLDVPIVLSGADGQRRVDGLVQPTSSNSLITLEGAVQGAWQWGTAQAAAGAITLTLAPPITAYRDGLLVRFLAPTNLDGALTLNVDGMGALPLLRPDGLNPVRGQVRQGTLCEAMQAGGRFILMSAAERGCPPGSLFVNDRYCIDSLSTNNQIFYTAVSFCANRGGKLCTWDEYHAACAFLGAQLGGMYNQWEWIDDTSNHTQTVDQAGRTTCQSQRSAGNPPVTTGDTRCCYHPR